MITEKIFVTNNHVLVQFDSYKIPKKDEKGQVILNSKRDSKQSQTVILNKSGKIVTQRKNVQEILDMPILAESNMKTGKKYLLFQALDNNR